MAGLLQELISGLSLPDRRDEFNVHPVAGHDGYYAARDHEGHGALLVRSAGPDRPMPLRLAGIDARFAAPCTIVTPDGEPRLETLSCIVCLSAEREVESYFCGISELLMNLLGDAPRPGDVAAAVMQLVDIFERLRAPARSSIVGLLGELCLIRMALHPSAAVRAWRVDAEERFDFVAGEIRMDVKAATNRGRVHSISFEQANPPEGTRGIIASIWIELAGGGTSMAELIDEIARRLDGDGAALLALRNTVGDSLGDTLFRAMSTRFDLALARSSVRLYSSAEIPAIRPPLPTGVSGVRFNCDLGDRYIEIGELMRSLTPEAQRILPQR